MTSHAIATGLAVLTLGALCACNTGGRLGRTNMPEVYYQAHRGGLREVPENTLAAFRHAWQCPGAIPEVDIRTTKDGVMICMHDDTLARTTNAVPPDRDSPVSNLTFAEIRQWDAGIWFAEEYAGEKVPALAEVFDEMRGRPTRELYLDLKGVDTGQLLALIGEYGLNDRVIFVHGSPATCLELSRLYPGARTMTWLSGEPEDIARRFDELARTGFEGISQIQLHLKAVRRAGKIAYVFDDAFLRRAVETAAAAGTELQVRPFRFDEESLRGLVGLGIRWYVTDEPGRFTETLGLRERDR